MYHDCLWRFQRKRPSGKGFERCGGRSGIAGPPNNVLSGFVLFSGWILFQAHDRAMNRPRLYAAVEPQVSKTARPGAPGEFTEKQTAWLSELTLRSRLWGSDRSLRVGMG